MASSYRSKSKHYISVSEILEYWTGGINIWQNFTNHNVIVSVKTVSC